MENKDEILRRVVQKDILAKEKKIEPKINSKTIDHEGVVMIDKRIRDLAGLCSKYEEMNRNRWIELLILREAREKYNLELPKTDMEFVTND